MIFNTLIKGGGGITGKPIEVTELPTPTASDVDKIYLLKNEEITYLSPQVGQPFGNKIYFNTELNPLDYTSNFQGGTDLLRTENTGDYYSLGFVDILALQGIEGYGHAYVIGVTNGDMSVILGLSYIYCDVLSVDQFNAMIGSQFGVSIPSFGWLASEIDTSAIADRIVNTNRLPDFDNIAYTSKESTFKEEYYKCVEVKDAIEVGKPVPEILYFDTSKTPDFDRSAADTQTVYLATQDQYFTVAAQYMSGEGASNMDGSVEALFLTFSQSVPIYLYIGGTASLEVINNLAGMFGEITHKGWQIDGTLNIPEKGLEIATNLGLTQEEFEQALALAFADPVVTFNDPQGLFLFPSTYKFEPLGESGFPIEVEELPTNVTEDDVGKVYLNTTTNEYYAYSYSPLVVGEGLGTVITYDTSKTPTFVTNAQHNYLIAADDFFLIAGNYFSNEETNGEGDAYVIMAGTPIAQRLLYVDGSASIEAINTALQNTNLEPVTYKGWQGTGNLDIITWLISIGNTSVSAEQIQEIKDLLDALPIIEINDSEGLFAKGLALSLNNKSTFARELSQKNTEISTLTDEKNALSNEVVAMVQRYVPEPYKWGDTTRSNIRSYEFSGWDKYNGALQIPDSITSLQERAFYGSDVAAVTLHDGITRIPYSCFENSSTSVGLPSTVTHIYDRAFYGNDNIFTLNIPASVTDIGEAAFANMKELSSITVEDGNEKYQSIDGVLYRKGPPTRLCCYPADKTGTDFSTTANVDSYAFDGCNILKNLTVEGSIQKNAFKGCTSLVSLHIGDFDDGLTLNDMFGGNIPHTLTSIEVGEYYSIPDRFFAGAWNVKSISLSFNTYIANNFIAGVGNYAFSGCSDLNSLALTSPSLRYIGIYALSGCSSLTSLELSDEILIIADSAFNGCTALPNVELPNKLLVIGRDAFGYCTSLNSIHIPDSVTFIKDYAFADCTGLTSATIGCGVTNIGAWLFGNCTNLRSVTCKAVSPPITDGDIFHGCTSLNEIYVPAESVEAYKSATNWSKYADRIQAIPTEGLAYTLNSGGASYSVSGIGTAIDTDIVIPDTYEGLPVTAVGSEAFKNNTNITNVIIGDSVTSISYQAFYGCKNCLKYDFSNHISVPTLGSNVFGNTNANFKIIVPDALYDSWIAATNWANYASRIIRKSEYMEV